MKRKREHILGGTETLAGFIPYLPFGNLLLPVKLDIVRGGKVRQMEGLQPPLRRGGFLVFALPGGGDYVSDRT